MTILTSFVEASEGIQNGKVYELNSERYWLSQVWGLRVLSTSSWALRPICLGLVGCEKTKVIAFLSWLSSKGLRM